MLKCLESREDFQRALFERTCAPRKDSSTPAFIYLGRRPKSAMPDLMRRTMFNLAAEKKLREDGAVLMQKNMKGVKGIKEMIDTE